MKGRERKTNTRGERWTDKKREDKGVRGERKEIGMREEG